MNLAKQYEHAAEICKRTASVIIEVPDLVSVQADTHMISLDGPEKCFSGLVEDDILCEIDYDEYDDDEEE